MIKKIFLTILLCLVSLSSFAKDDSKLFSVYEIYADVTEETSVKAKNTAILASQKQAFNMLVKRLSMLNEKEISNLNVSNEEINSLLYDFNISEERTSDVRYTGTLNFNFNPKKTSDFLKRKNISFTTLRSGPVLVIPIWMVNDKEILLWEDDNVWKKAWEKYPNDSFLVPTKAPLGDLTDLSMLSLDNILTGSVSNVEEISKRYGVKDVVFTVARKDKEGLIVTINRYGLNEVSSQSSVFVEGKDKTYKQVLTEAITKVNNELGKLWKEKTITKPDEANYIYAKIEVSSIKDLNKIKEILDNLTIIYEFKENILTVDSVIFDVYYQGSFFDLKLALSQVGIIAEKTNENSCNLTWE